jgi:uncharacterized protein DUF1573
MGMKRQRIAMGLSTLCYTPLVAGIVLLVLCLCAATITSGALAQSPSGFGSGFSAGSASSSTSTNESGGASGGLAPLIQGPASSGGIPKVEAIDPIYNFGTAPSGPPVNHVFKIRNAGTGTLTIDGVTTSCGCTAAKPTKNSLGPGEESDIAVTFDTISEKGPSTRTITVVTNDPKQRQLALTLKGDLRAQVEAAPPFVAFGIVKHGVEKTSRVTIADLVNDKELHVGPITNSSANVKVSQEPRTDGKPGAMLSVTLLKSMPVGPFDDTIKVSTGRAPLIIAVYGTVTGDLTVSPAQVSFGIVPHHQSALRIVRLSNAGGQAINVLGVTSSNQSVTAAVEPIKAGKEYKVTLELRPNTPDGALRGAIAIRTDDPQETWVNVPFYGIVGSFKG